MLSLSVCLDRAAALKPRALNVLSLLTAYQAELFQDYMQAHDLAILDEIPAITDLCLRIQRCAVQATGKTLGSIVLEERTPGLQVSNLSDREKDEVLDVPIVPEGLFGLVLSRDHAAEM